MKKKYEDAEYPLYEIVVDDTDKTGIRLLSIVEDPAIEMKGVAFDANGSVKKYEFKAQEDKQMIIGPAMIPNKKILRKNENGDYYYTMFKPETIVKLVQKFNSSGTNRRINVDHSKQMVDAYMMENWIVEDEYYDKSRKYGFDVPIGTWMVCIKIEDKKFWLEEVKELGKFGFSIEGIMGEKVMQYNSQLTIDDHIDSLSDDELNELLFAIKSGVAGVKPKKKWSGYGLPPVHPNCVCEIDNNGEWILKAAATESGPCETCIDAQNNYNSYRQRAKAFANEKISFDFDDTLNTERGKELAKKKISEGYSVYIISARDNAEGMFKIADELGVPHSRVFATGSNRNKVEKVKQLGIETHYDNNQDVVDDLEGIAKKFVAEPESGENKEEFVSRCIGIEINAGKDPSQAAAICYTKWEDRSMEEVKMESYRDYPDAIKSNAKKVLEWTEKNGWGSCGTPVGKQRANQLAKGEPISLETIKRMYSYLSRHEVDLEKSKSYSDGCGKLMYDSWGGKAALGWSRNKLRELGELDK